MFDAINLLYEHRSHCILLRSIWIDYESFVWVGVGIQDGIGYFSLDLVEAFVFFLPTDKWYTFLC